MSLSMFVPRFMDENNRNAQNNNARSLLRYWPESDFRITTLTYGSPDREAVCRKGVRIIRLWRRHGWMFHLFLRYLRHYDLVFYPGVHAADAAGLRLRRLLGFSSPVIATLEGLLGDDRREKEYSEWAGHPVFCQHVPTEVLHRSDEILRSADHIIAISPFLAKIGKLRYGDKFSVLPLGIDLSLFHPPAEKKRGRVRVISAGRVESHKQPEMFLSLAERYPEAEFFWYGEGALRRTLTEDAKARKLINISFPGELPPSELADAFRNADIFVMPSRAEGAPKVVQEAAACGLPVVLFGFYQAPSVIDEENGFVVWNNDGMYDRVEKLLKDPELRESMGRNGSRLAAGWDWRQIAPQWEQTLARQLLHVRSLA
jgi:glycosyltransferase involved in cell wall biosynthesis